MKHFGLIVIALNSVSSGPHSSPGFRFSKVTKIFFHTFLIWTVVPFIQEVSGAYTCLFLDRDQSKMALHSRKVSVALEKRAPGQDIVLCSWERHFTLMAPLSTQVQKVSAKINAERN